MTSHCLLLLLPGRLHSRVKAEVTTKLAGRAEECLGTYRESGPFSAVEDVLLILFSLLSKTSCSATDTTI